MIDSNARFRLFAFLALTLVLAVLLIATLMLVGVRPAAVFAPGFAVKALFARAGIKVPNGVGVLSTVAVWWGGIVLAWLALRRLAPRQR